MISDSGMEGEEEQQPTMGEEESQMGEMQGSMETPPEETTPTPVEVSKKKTGGRRAALKIVRENVDRVGKDLANFRKAHEVSSKKLEKQIAQLRSDISALKSHVAKEASKAREKQESMSNKILSKLTQKPKAAPKKKVSAPKKKKGKK